MRRLLCPLLTMAALAACASHSVRCDSRLRPINPPAADGPAAASSPADVPPADGRADRTPP